MCDADGIREQLCRQQAERKQQLVAHEFVPPVIFERREPQRLHPLAEQLLRIPVKVRLLAALPQKLLELQYLPAPFVLHLLHAS